MTSALLFALLAGPALAGDPHGAHPPEPAAHGDAHGEPHGEAHDAAAGHHVAFTDDDDLDGTANWMDQDSPGYVIKGVLVHAANLIGLLVLIAIVVRRPLNDAVGNRAIEIKRAITEAASAHAAAKSRNDQVVARLDALSAEIARMKQDAAGAMVAEEQKLVLRAKEEAERIAETAERNVREEVARAKVALRKEAVDLAVRLAEDTLKKQVHPADQRRLARAFLDSLNEGTHG